MRTKERTTLPRRRQDGYRQEVSHSERDDMTWGEVTILYYTVGNGSEGKSTAAPNRTQT